MIYDWPNRTNSQILSIAAFSQTLSIAAFSQTLSITPFTIRLYQCKLIHWILNVTHYEFINNSTNQEENIKRLKEVKTRV